MKIREKKIVSTILHGILLYSVLQDSPSFDLNARTHRYVPAFQHNHKKWKDNLETRFELAVLRTYVENQAVLEPIPLSTAPKCKQTKEQAS